MPARELFGIGDRRRRADERRVRSVEGADPSQTAQHVRDVRSENAAIRVQLVEHNVAEVLEELHPLGVVGEDARVEHVRVRDDDVSSAANRRAHRGRGVAVVRVGLEIDIDILRESLKLGELILGERLRREDVERAGRRILRDRVDDRKVVAEGLAARGRGDDDGVLSGVGGLERVGLVGVEREDPAPPERRRDAAVEPGGVLRVARASRRNAFPPRDHLAEVRVARERVEDLLEAYSRWKSNGRSHASGRYGTGVLTSRQCVRMPVFAGYLLPAALIDRPQ